MHRGALSYLISRQFSVALLKVAAAYLSCLTVLWFLDLRPPPGYMVWGFLVLWGLLFLINLTASLFRETYTHKGNLIFHAAFLVVASGIALSAIYRFEGETVVLEGDSFFSEENEYIRHSAGSSFGDFAPDLSFKVTDINPEFWEGRLHFTALEAVIKHSASTLEKTSVVWLNGGPRINGARLRLTEYGIFPELLIELRGRTFMKGPFSMHLFPPGSEDSFEVKNYKIYLQLYTDPVRSEQGGRLKNASMNLVEPLLLLRVEWFGRKVYEGVLSVGQKAGFGDVALTFKGVKKFVGIGVVKDPGQVVVFLGFIIAVAGLALRVFRFRDHRSPQSSTETSGVSGEGSS